MVNLLTSSNADIATITECEIPEGAGDFSVAGYTTFSPALSLQGRKTRVLVLVKNDLALRANVKVVRDIMDPSIQSVWLQFSHHRIGGSTLGAFILGGIYREWTPQLSREESKLRMEALLRQITTAAEGSRVIIHGDFNLDLDRANDGTYYMATLARSLAESTAASGLEAHATPPTFRSYGNFVPGGSLRPAGDSRSPAGGSPSPAGGSSSPAGDDHGDALGPTRALNVCDAHGPTRAYDHGDALGPTRALNVCDAHGPTRAYDDCDHHKYARLDHVYSKGFDTESRVTQDATTDHRPVVTTVRAGGRGQDQSKLIPLKRRNFKAIRREDLEGTLRLTDWSGVYAMRDVDDILHFITAGIIAALDIVAPEKVIKVKNGPNLYLTRETLEAMRMRDMATGKKYRDLRNEVSRLVRSCR